MMKKMMLFGCALACAQVFSGIKEELEKGFLPGGAAGSSWASVYQQVDELDAQADRGWLRLGSR